MNILGIMGNILWVLGLSILIAATGWRNWLKRGGQVNSKGYISDAPFHTGAYLFFSGILLSTNTLWVRFVFILLIIAFSIAINMGKKSTRKEPH